MSWFPVELKGSHWDIGVERGRIFRDLFHHLAQIYLPSYVGAEKVEHERLTEQMRKQLEKKFPEYAEELRGMAKGSGLSEQEIFMLHAATEHFPPGIKFPSDCTGIAFIDSDVGPILGQTCDGDGFWTNVECVMTIIKPKGGYSHLITNGITWLGGGRSVNERGLCIGGGSVQTIDTAEGISQSVLLRAVNERCATVKEAISLLKDYEGHIGGENILLLDASGDAAVVEKSPTKQAVREPENRGICNANHFITDEMKDLNASTKDRIERYSEPRLYRMWDFIKSEDRTNAIQSFKKIIRSHGLGGLCYHGDPWPYPTITTMANIILAEKRDMLVSFPRGFPCKAEFIRFRNPF